MSLELKKICSLSYQHESIQPFSIQSSPKGVFSIMTKASLQIMRPEFSFKPELNMFGLKPFVIKCPQGMPTNELDCEEIEIYNSADRLERQTLLLDQRFFPKLSNKDGAEIIQSRAVAWSPSGTVGYLSNYGGLEIYKELENEWEKVVDVGKEYFKYLVKGKTFPLKTMTDLNNIVQDIILTSMSFCQIESQESLIATTKSNKVVLFHFENQTVKVASVSSPLVQKGVITLKPFSKNGALYFTAGSIDGQLGIYRLGQSGQVSLESHLCQDPDLLAVTEIEISTLDMGFLVLASKGGHLVSFELDSNFKSVQKTHEMISWIPITGLTSITKTSFIVTTLTGGVKSITVSLDPLSIESHDIRLDFTLPGSCLYGVSSSPNQAYFVLTSFVTEAHDHLTLRNPLTLTVCRLGSSDPIIQLLSVPSLSLLDGLDYAEVVRYLAAKDIKLIKSYETEVNLTQNVGFTREFQFLLKISAVITGARYTYFRLRSTAEADVSSNRFQRLGHVLDTIRAFDVLTVLNRKVQITPFETRSGYYLRIAIQEYIATTPATDEFVKIYDQLSSELINLVQVTAEKFIPNFRDRCSLCDKDLESNGFRCEEGHSQKRCCITQVPMDDLKPLRSQCHQCWRCVWNDLEEIRKVVGDNDKLLMCPLCDTSFIF